MKKLLIILNLLTLIILSSCGGKKADTYTLSWKNGFLVNSYAQYASYSWIPSTGVSNYKFTSDDGIGSLTITYKSYSDVYGNCTGTITSTLEESNETELASATSSSGSGSYDVFSPYVVTSTVTNDSSSVLLNVILKATVSSMSVTNCPFPTYTTNYYIVTLFKSGTFILTDWNRSKDFLLAPVK